jgi:hypothetical protein
LRLRGGHARFRGAIRHGHEPDREQQSGRETVSAHLILPLHIDHMIDRCLRCEDRRTFSFMIAEIDGIIGTDGQSDKEIIDTVFEQYLDELQDGLRAIGEPGLQVSIRLAFALTLLAGHHHNGEILGHRKPLTVFRDRFRAGWSAERLDRLRVGLPRPRGISIPKVKYEPRKEHASLGGAGS